MKDNEEKDKGFTVVDRRFWQQDENDLENENSDESLNKPTYVLDLEKKLEEKDKLLQEYITKHKESLNEFDSAKQRIKRDVSKEVERSQRTVLVEFLEVLDNLDRALDSVPNGEVSSFVQGVSLVRDLFINKLSSLGAKRTDSLGKKFDPAEHEAVSIVPVENPEWDGQIVGVVRGGYVMGDSILRPAGVVVGRYGNG